MIRLLHGDCRAVLPTLAAGSVHCVVTPILEGFHTAIWYDAGMSDGRIKKGQRLSPATEFKPGRHWRPHGEHRDRDWLCREYVERGRSAADIAAERGLTEGAIHFWLHRHAIPRRSISEARKLKYWGAVGEANPMFGKFGPTNPNYIDGSSPERQRAYARTTGMAFLRAGYQRDGYRCVRCGTPKGRPRSLHAHHIAPWAGNEALRFDLSNAVTLCRPCHSWAHSRRNTAREYLA